MVLTAEQTKLLEDRRRVKGAIKFDPSKGPWRTFEQSYLTWANMSGIADMGEFNQPEEFKIFSKLTLINCMTGSAVERTRPVALGTDSYNNANDLNSYVQILRAIFQPPSESRSLKQEFRNYKQNASEDVSSYLSMKLNLYDLAFTGQNQDFEVLLTDIIDGLYNNTIKKLLRRENPGNRDDLRSKLIEIVSREREAYMKGYGDVVNLDGLMAVSQPFRAGSHVATTSRRLDDDVEYMDIDQLRESIRAFRTGNVPPKDGKDRRTCYKCGKVGHLSKQCKVMVKDQNKDPKKRDCFYCLKAGHFARDCMKKKADIKKGINRKSIRELYDRKEDDKEDSDSDDEGSVHFLGNTRGVRLH